ncbi:unnamed protein product [Vicia faba]|uniref:Uncharacterized protein n=1 Tax=Vicia faba TaxID=3906 RepID=A0AAV0ZX84_VICFA|nr:unnamed protein product [Vicia faba]
MLLLGVQQLHIFINIISHDSNQSCTIKTKNSVNHGPVIPAMFRMINQIHPSTHAQRQIVLCSEELCYTSPAISFVTKFVMTNHGQTVTLLQKMKIERELSYGALGFHDREAMMMNLKSEGDGKLNDEAESNKKLEVQRDEADVGFDGSDCLL